MKEDDLTNTIIQHEQNSVHRLDKLEDAEHEAICEPEAHYNHYGDRGVVDLYVQIVANTNGAEHTIYEHIYEIKSGDAIEEATGANEIIRQFNRHCEYFFRDEQRSRESFDPVFELCFLPEPTVIDHVWDNRLLYANAAQKRPYTENAEHPKCLVGFRHPDEYSIAHIAVDGDVRSLERIRNDNRVVAEQIENTIEWDTPR